jgi:hypothetical protein
VTSGQYGIFGSIVVIARDDGGAEVIRRSQISQESFAKFAYFTDIEPSNISFGGGDAIFGPVHTNSDLKIYSSGATFYAETRTAQRVPTPQYGTFMQGYEEYVPRIEMPATQDLNKVQAQAAAGGTSFTGDSDGGQGAATTRIDFVAIDLNGDGDTTDDDEGFFKVYQSTDPDWVVGNPPMVTETYNCGSWWNPRTCTRQVPGPLTAAQNCGAFYGSQFVAAADHPFGGNSALQALRSATRRCFLGGVDEIYNEFRASTPEGAYLPYPGTPAPPLAGRLDADYLFPLARRYNPNFKGVIFVEGKVAIAGVLRGNVTVAASDDIILADDIVYATDPGAGLCQDMLGIFAGDDVVVSDNALNSPLPAQSGEPRRTYDDTSSEFFQGVVLALDIFTVENYGSGGRTEEPCGTQAWGRGCLFLTGGIIQSTRGAVGTGAGTGYIKRYSYDQCAATSPPPYFPTTGRFAKGQYYQVDPVGFNVGNYYQMLTPR